MISRESLANLHSRACVAASVSLYYRVVESRTDDLTWFLFDVQFLK